VDAVLVATTVDPADDPVAALCAARGYPSYRGSVHNVLDRYYQAARAFRAQIIVRLTADCPVIDPGLIDEVVNALLGRPAMSDQRSAAGSQPTTFNLQSATRYDFAANRLPPPWKRTYPIGLDVEACTFQALERAWREADQPHQREHVMPYLYEQEGRFRVLVLNAEQDYGALRWTVDTPEDLELLRRIYAHFGGRDDFSWLEVLALVEKDPSLVEMNAGVRPKIWREVDSRRET
jgi:spore coat polysaccharide biosynthesis protein SpsF